MKSKIFSKTITTIIRIIDMICKYKILLQICSNTYCFCLQALHVTYEKKMATFVVHHPNLQILQFDQSTS